MPAEPIPKTDLLRELKRLDEELDKPPSEQDMNDLGKYSQWPYYREFGSWNEAIRAAGFEPRVAPKERTEEELVAELQRLATQLDRKPSKSDVKECGKYSDKTYQNKFGSWNEALSVAGFEPRRNGTKISDDELCSVLREMSKKLDHRPTTTDMREEGPFSPGTYIQRFGSWEKALEAAGL